MVLLGREQIHTAAMDLSWDLPRVPSPGKRPFAAVAARKASPVAHNMSPVAGLKRPGRFVAFQRAIIEGRALLDPEQPAKGSWLEERCVGRSWGVGCRACAASGLQGPWAQFRMKAVSADKIQRHARAASHVRAARVFGTSSPCQAATPTVQDFLAVLDERQKGASYRAGSSVAGAEKASRMSWCLAEALRDSDRTALRKSRVITLHQDVSTKDSMLLVRFSAVGAPLEIRKGILGVRRGFGTTALDVRDALLNILQKACAPRLGCQRRHKLSTAESSSATAVDQELLAHVLLQVEMFDADAAADEQRAGRLLRQHCPNMKVIQRDRTHAATRPGPRPPRANCTHVALE